MVESRCGAVALGRTYLLPPLSSGGASMVPPCSVSTSRSSVGSRAGAPVWPGGPDPHHVSSPLHVARNVRISRIARPHLLHAKALDVYSPPQVLQINGRLCHLVLAFPYVGDIANGRAPWLRGHYSASSLLRTQPPPSRLRPTSRFRRLYGLPCSDDFAPGRGGLLQLLGMSLSPCCRFHPAEVNSRIGQCSAAHAAFALRR